MIKKVTEIVNAWIIAANPTKEQTILADARLKICNSCEFIRHQERSGNPYCGDCGCPLKKKIFSKKYDACPKHYWLEVENTDVFKNTQKNTKTMV
jgi:hypothetical protein